ARSITLRRLRRSWAVIAVSGWVFWAAESILRADGVATSAIGAINLRKRRTAKPDRAAPCFRFRMRSRNSRPFGGNRKQPNGGPHMQKTRPGPGFPCCVILRPEPLYLAEQDQYQNDDENGPKDAGRPVTPTSGVWKQRQSADQQDNQDDNQN